MTIQQCHYLIVDWGTTNFRAFAMSSEHELLATKEMGLGLLQVKDGQFALELQKVLEGWIDAYHAVPIFMAGMVGSLKGWVNVDYARTPALATDLVNKAHRFTLPWGAEATIVPGVCHQFEDDKHDVMRGEEVQIFGLSQLRQTTDFDAILPGTHSKHVQFREGKLASFATYMTGELYSVLSKHSLLGKDLPLDSRDEEAFEKGVRDSQQGSFSNRIFLAWTQRIFAELNEQQIPNYLSGLLIGFELKECASSQVFIVGGDALSSIYQRAAKMLNIESDIVSGNDCFLAGMSLLIKDIIHE